VALPFKVASSSQAKQGRIMSLTRSSPDYNWATDHIVSLLTGNGGGCPHHYSPLLNNKGPSLIPNDESGLVKDWIMESLMHRLRSLALHTKLVDPHDPTTMGKPKELMQSPNCNSGGAPLGKAQSPQKTSLIREGWLSVLRWLPPKLSKVG
jgi:hypothetical protein